MTLQNNYYDSNENGLHKNLISLLSILEMNAVDYTAVSERELKNQGKVQQLHIYTTLIVMDKVEENASLLLC